MNLKEFGLYLTKIREKSGYSSQRQLAIKSGISNGTIARIEGGTQKATPETLAKLASCLRETTYEDLMKAAGYINGEPKKPEKNIDKEIEELVNDPDFMVAYKEYPGSKEEAKEDLIGFLKVITEREKRKKKK